MEEILRQTEGESLLGSFQQEMAKFAAGEASGEIESGHFLKANIPGRETSPEFDPLLLTEEDRDVWEKIKKGTITADDLHRYAFEVSALGNDDPARSTRVMFSEFAGNKAMLAIFESSGLRKKEEK